MKTEIKYTISILLLSLLSSCIKTIGNTNYYLDNENYTIENDYVDWSVIKQPGYGIMGAYYNDDYVITYRQTVDEFIVDYYIIQLNHSKHGYDKWMAFKYKEDYFKARDSLGLDEKKMTLIKW